MGKLGLGFPFAVDWQHDDLTMDRNSQDSLTLIRLDALDKRRSHSHSSNKSLMGHEYCLLSCPHDWCGKDTIGSCTVIMHGLECYEVTNGS